MRTLTVLVATIVLASCGGSKTTTSTVAQPTAAGAGQSAAVASSLNCGAVKPVWVNLKSKAYHEAGDPYYGRTKHGKYMCPSAAVAAGYHAAGGQSSSSATRRHKKAEAVPTPSPSS